MRASNKYMAINAILVVIMQGIAPSASLTFGIFALASGGLKNREP